MAESEGEASPCLLVDDVARTAEYYRTQMGFEVGQAYGSPPEFVICRLGGAEVMFRRFDGDPRARSNRRAITGSFDVYIRVSDARGLHERFAKNGVTILQGLVDREYGMREFLAEDLNGYAIAFGQEMTQ